MTPDHKHQSNMQRACCVHQAALLAFAAMFRCYPKPEAVFHSTRFDHPENQLLYGRLTVQEQALIALAGPVAVARYSNIPLDPKGKQLAFACELAKIEAPNDWFKRLEEWIGIAAMMLRCGRDIGFAVLAVYERLNSAGMLTAPQVVEVLASFICYWGPGLGEYRPETPVSRLIVSRDSEAVSEGRDPGALTISRTGEAES
jgi:hypothetical protein